MESSSIFSLLCSQSRPEKEMFMEQGRDIKSLTIMLIIHEDEDERWSEFRASRVDHVLVCSRDYSLLLSQFFC